MPDSNIPYRSIIDALPVPCALNDEFGNITFLNKAFIQSLGYTLDDVANISDWWPRAYPDPAYRQWVTEAWTKLLETMPTSASTQSMEAKIRTKDGRDVIMNVSACPLEGVPLGVHVVMFQDITSQKSAEAKSLELRERLERTEKIAGVGGWEFDQETGQTIWTPGTYLIHDVDPVADGEATRASAQSMAKLAPEVAQAFTNTIQGGRVFDVEYPTLTSKGRKVWLHLRAHGVWRDGKVVSIFGHTQDITARKAAEEKNTELLERLERTEQMAGIGGWEYFPATGRSIWTAGHCLLHDLNPNDPPEVLEAHVQTMSEHALPENTAAFQNAIERGTPFDVTFPSVTAKGRKIWLHSRGEPVLRDGKVVSFNGLTQDVTARKNAEDQLRAAQKMEAVGQLTAGIAHDFNNLLAVIMANLELLEEAVADHPLLKRRVQAALNASDRGAELTQHLLAFGRNQALTPRLYDLRERVEHSVRLLKRTLPGHIEIDITTDPAPIWVKVDEAQFENALLNMGLNARDAMPHGGALRFSVTTCDVPADPSKNIRPGRYAAIAIQDTGVGMRPDIMERIFDPFFTTKPTGQGSGMGLSMVHGFVHQSQGHVLVASSPGAGTTFTLLFPLAESPRAEAFVRSPAAADTP